MAYEGSFADVRGVLGFAPRILEKRVCYMILG